MKTRFYHHQAYHAAYDLYFIKLLAICIITVAIIYRFFLYGIYGKLQVALKSFSHGILCKTNCPIIISLLLLLSLLVHHSYFPLPPCKTGMINHMYIKSLSSIVISGLNSLIIIMGNYI